MVSANSNQQFGNIDLGSILTSQMDYLSEPEITLNWDYSLPYAHSIKWLVLPHLDFGSVGYYSFGLLA